MAEPHVLAIDAGTTSNRAILFDVTGRPVAVGQRELPQSYPAPGWVEHDPDRIRDDVVAVCREALETGGVDPDGVAAIGITNQRETTVLWDRATGRPVHPAIVWQDRRTAAECERLREAGLEPEVQGKTGLLLDPYFSATKLAWLLDHVEGARSAAERGELAFGTIDAWILWHLTGGRLHATDASNASRTLLFDLHRQEWDDDLLRIFRVPRSVLPEVRDSSGLYAETDPALLGTAIPVAGIAGDQQAAAFGQAAFRPGTMKSTYGTGAFLLLNTGGTPVASSHRLLTTVAWRREGRVTYALEGSIFIAGAAIQWLRDGLGLLETAAESEVLAASVVDTGGVYLVPAFVGLGAPHWDAEARGAILGLTRDSGPAQIVRAALESLAYQTHDLLEAMEADGAARPRALRVDGGLVRNGWAMQFLADVLELPVERPAVTETTALGAAYLAGLATGVWSGEEEIAGRWRCERRWEPAMERGLRESLLAGWRSAVERVLSR